MRNFDFTLRQLQYAVTVAETQGFRSAAQRCGVSQPSLSAQIARLEDALGVTLFERHARQTLLTVEGRDVILAMRSVLQASERLHQRAVALSTHGGVPLRIGVIPTLAPYLLPRVAPPIGGEVPQRVYWLEMRTRDCRDALLRGELDAILIADPPISDACEAAELGWEPFYLVGAEGSLPRGSIALDQLESGQLMLLEEGHCLREHTLSLCNLLASGTSPYRGTSLSTILTMVATGLGTTVLPATALPCEVPLRQLEVRPFDEPIGRTVRLVWRSRSPRIDRLRRLARSLQDGLAASTEEARMLASSRP
ncbi:MAG: hydrogen peroxide-inducible genes activator [Myxococcota bacterium]